MSSVAQAQPKPTAIIVQQGKLLDFVDGETQRYDTPEEYVRQEIAKSLVREYGYAKRDMAVEFTLRMGSRKPRADLIIFPEGEAHKQENALILVECKASTVKAADRKEGVEQLRSYMSACPNVLYGMWTNGIERFCYRRVIKGGKVDAEEVPDLPECGKELDAADRPRFDQLKPATSDALLFAFRRCHNYISGNQGFDAEQWEALASALKQHGRKRDVAKQEASAFGTKYVVQCMLMTPDHRDPCICSVWITEGSEAPRLITAYPSAN